MPNPDTFPDIGSSPSKSAQEEIRLALGALLADVRPVQDDEHPERTVVCSTTVAKIRRARAALQALEAR